MGLYIKDMGKPDRCETCCCHTRDDRHFDVICELLHRTIAINDCDYEEPTIPPEDCPLVEVSKPHGRLIDADKLSREVYESRVHNTHDRPDQRQFHEWEHRHFQGMIWKAETVIDGEK